MSDIASVSPPFKPQGYLGSSPSRGDGSLPSATTSSQALNNASADSSIQFNSDVARSTKTSYSRDSVQIEDRRIWEQGRVNFSINFGQTTPQHHQAPYPLRHTATSPASMDAQHPQYLETSTRPAPSRLRSDSVMPDRPFSPGLPTPISASSSTMAVGISHGLTQKSQDLVDMIQKRISDIDSLYEALQIKLARLRRIPGLDSLPKDLDAQRGMLFVTVKQGRLICCLETTLKAPFTKGYPSSPTVQKGMEDVESIQGRLDHIHKLLSQVEMFSEELLVEPNKILVLPVRQRKDLVKSPVMDRGARITKSRKQSSISKTRSRVSPEILLRSTVNILASQLEELQRLCQKLQPPWTESSPEATEPVPRELELTREVAVMLCKALCQVCPNKKHLVHQVLFGLTTEEILYDLSKDVIIQFNLAFECSESETWFIVHSTVKGEDDEDMREDGSIDYLHPGRLSDPPSAISEPNARFCLQYYKQGTDDLAVAVQHTNLYMHEVFYPDQARLDIIRGNGRATSLRQLLEEPIPPMRRLSDVERVHLATKLAEAFLKFHSEDWLSCKWDCDNVLIHDIDGSLEPHLRFELRSPSLADEEIETDHQSRQMSSVLYQLGALLRCIAVGTSPGSSTCAEANIGLGATYAEIIQTCLDLGKNIHGLGVDAIQEVFHAKVVVKLSELEGSLADIWFD